MNKCTCPIASAGRPVLRDAIDSALVPAHRLLQVIELIDLCRGGNSVGAIEQVCNRIADLMTANAALESCGGRDHNCKTVTASRGYREPGPGHCDQRVDPEMSAASPSSRQTLVISGQERIQLAIGPSQLQLCYLPARDQVGICFKCIQQTIRDDIGSYLPLIYLLPHLHAMYKRIVGQSPLQDPGSSAGPPLDATLTPREMDVLRWIAAGKTNWEIGRIMDVSERTVKFHLANTLGKLKAVNRAQAVVKAQARGLVPD